MKNSKKNVLITGTSTGIGHASVLYLSERGYHVYAGVRTEADYKKWEGLENVTPVILDITVKEDILAVKAKIEKECGSLYALINNAGVTCWGPLLDIDEDKVIEPFRVNLHGTYLMTKYFLPLLSKENSRLVNIGSNSARIRIPFMGPYPLSKLALRGFTEAIRRELLVKGEKNIKVVLIEPGSIVTPMWDKAIANISFPADTEFNKKIREMGIFLTKDDMANSPQPVAVAKVINKILEKKKPKQRYDVGRHKYTLMIFSHLPAILVDGLLKVIIASTFKKIGK